MTAVDRIVHQWMCAFCWDPIDEGQDRVWVHTRDNAGDISLVSHRHCLEQRLHPEALALYRAPEGR
jgi:hypothetical protein